MEILKKIKTQLITGDGNTSEVTAVKSIPIHLVMPSQNGKRRSLDHDALKELSDSIRRYGILQPVTVRKKNDLTYEIISGDRRLRAASLAGLLKIPAIVRNVEDIDGAVISLSDNLQRQELDFMEEAAAYREIISEFSITQEELASRLGKSQSSVANKMRLLKLPQSVREIVRDNGLSERHARVLLRLSDEANQIKAAEAMVDLRLGIRQSEDLVEKMIEDSGEHDIPKKIGRSISDVRVFMKTISKAVSIMNERGIEASAKKDETDRYYECVIRIEKGV